MLSTPRDFFVGVDMLIIIIITSNITIIFTRDDHRMVISYASTALLAEMASVLTSSRKGHTP